MPRNAVNAGCIDFILSPKDIARELGGISQHPYVARVMSPAAEAVQGMVGSDLNEIVAALSEVDKSRADAAKETRKAIAGNTCRCTGYQAIVDAIETVMNKGVR